MALAAIAAAAPVDQVPFHCLLLALRPLSHLQPCMEKGSLRPKGEEDGGILFLYASAWVPSSKRI